MAAWQLTSKDLKRYPHFDSQISIEDAVALATDPKSVVAHKFYPFILYTNRWTRFAEKGEQGDVKQRPIRYASRGDAYIFAYYRHLLTQRYEEALSKNSLGGCVIAYRRILNADGTGKCNIHFASEAFEKIRELGYCCVVALDISSFFESLDHELLKSVWRDLLKVEKLPDDHYKIFRTITRYAVVEKQAVYERLGYYGTKVNPKSGMITSGYLVPYNKMPKQLCEGYAWRETPNKDVNVGLAIVEALLPNRKDRAIRLLSDYISENDSPESAAIVRLIQLFRTARAYEEAFNIVERFKYKVSDPAFYVAWARLALEQSNISTVDNVLHDASFDRKVVRAFDPVTLYKLLKLVQDESAEKILLSAVGDASVSGNTRTLVNLGEVFVEEDRIEEFERHLTRLSSARATEEVMDHIRTRSRRPGFRRRSLS